LEKNPAYWTKNDSPIKIALQKRVILHFIGRIFFHPRPLDIRTNGNFQ